MRMLRAGAIVCMFLGFATVAAVVPDRPSFGADGIIVVAQNDRPGNFFRRLFGGFREAPRLAPRPMFPGFERSPPPQQRERRVRQPTVAQPAPRAPVVEKAADAKRAVVIGDFMATSLAKGLTDAYSDNPNVVVIDDSNGSSGLVRKDFYDWPAAIPGIVAEQKPDVILVMIGANDRQGIDDGANSQAFGSDGWRAAYGARVAALADALKATGKPALWAGLVSVAPGAMSRDYSSFNGIVREQLDPKGLQFIDMWNGFADDEGKYVSVGPDVGGQSVQLRASDGLNFTRAGQRKLAYFVQQELGDIFGGNAPQVAAVDAVSTPTSPDAVDAPLIGPMVPLDALSLAGGDTLSSDRAEADRGHAAAAISARLTDAAAASPPVGRVDSYIWPPRPAPATDEPPAASATQPAAASTVAVPSSPSAVPPAAAPVQ